MSQTTPRQRVKGGPGRARWLALGGVAVVIIVLTFSLGILVGRQSARHTPPTEAVAEAVRKPTSPPRRSGLVERVPERSPAQEKLTFYQTLTAPLGAEPASSKVDMVAKPAAPKSRPPVERADPGAAGITAPAAGARQDKPGVPAREASAVQSTAADGRRGDWAVQAGAFKDRGPAEGVRRHLAAAGFDAYLVAVPGEGGEVRYKVRIGSFKTRDEAARTAERIRQERSLTAFVAPR
jgi:cell division protein FtsN